MEIISSLFVGIVGTGKVASALHRSLGPSHSVIFNSRTFESATRTSLVTCGAMIIAVSDDAIISVVKQLIHTVGEAIKKIPIIHCSGSLTSSIFEELGLIGASMHPAISIGADTTFKDVLCAVEGTEQGKKVIREVLALVGAESFEITTKDKVKYHVASVIASNFTAVLLNESYNLFLDCNLSSGSAKKLAEQLLSSSLPKAFSKDFGLHCTGPAARGDKDTMDQHRKLIADNKILLECYDSLTKLILKKL